MQKTIFFVLRFMVVSFIIYICLIFIGNEYNYERNCVGLGRKE